MPVSIHSSIEMFSSHAMWKRRRCSSISFTITCVAGKHWMRSQSRFRSGLRRVDKRIKCERPGIPAMVRRLIVVAFEITAIAVGHNAAGLFAPDVSREKELFA